MRQLWLFWMHLLKAHRDGSVEAAGLKAKLESYAFIVNLHIVEKVLAITFGLSEKLQETCLVVLKAMAVIRSTTEHLFTIRSDTEWEAVLEKAKSFAVTLGISPEYTATVSKSRSARLQKVSSLLSEYLTASTTGTKETMGADNAKRVYFSVIDCFVAKFCRQFSNNDALLQSLEAFDKNSPLFMDSAKIAVFADYYSAHVDKVILESQVRDFFLKCSEKPTNDNNFVRFHSFAIFACGLQ